LFNNLVNLHDFVRLAEKVRTNGIRPLVSKLLSGDDERVEKTWEFHEPTAAHWYDIPAVLERWNEKISGVKDIDSRSHVLRKYFESAGGLKAISLCCGAGSRELRWAQTGAFSEIDGYDLSESRIEAASTKAAQANLGSVLRFHSGDVRSVLDGNKTYDIILAESALHHLTPLESLLQRVSLVLSGNGYFIVDEFVGPSRFQWTDAQLKAANKLLQSLPESYRVFSDSKRIKNQIYRPGRLSMMMNDPSEAVESASIVPLISKHFNVIESRPYGGNLLHLVFSDIAHHFLNDDLQTKDLLRRCFDAEDEFLSHEGVTSDFVFMVCKKLSA